MADACGTRKRGASDLVADSRTPEPPIQRRAAAVAAAAAFSGSGSVLGLAYFFYVMALVLLLSGTCRICHWRVDSSSTAGKLAGLAALVTG